MVEDMNRLHAQMGGRDGRPERVALLKCMAILDKEIKRSRGDLAVSDGKEPRQG